MVAGLFAYGVSPRELMTMSFRELEYFEKLATDVVKARRPKPAAGR